MRIIFLDVDGVLNHENFYKRQSRAKEEGTYVDRGYHLNQFDPESIEILNGLIEATGAKVVVSASMRKNHKTSEIQSWMDQLGFTGEILDRTPSLSGDCVLRGNEILQWIKDNEDLVGQKYYNFTEYVILDDDSDMLYWQRNNFLLVDRYVGITRGTAFQAAKILLGGKVPGTKGV